MSYPARGSFDPRSYLGLTLLQFLLPLPVLLPVRYGLGEYGALSLPTFLIGSGLEVLLCLGLLFLRHQGRLPPARFETYDFLVRLLVGLPFTAYLTVAAPYSIIGLLRFFPGFAFLLYGRRFRFAGRFFLFFLAGGLLFALFKDFPFPGRAQSITLATAALLGGLLYGLGVSRRERELLLVRGERDRRRLARRLEHVADRERRVLEALLPGYEARLFGEDRNLHPRGGEGLVIAFRFPGIHESLADYAGAVDMPTREKGLDAFAAEWNRYVAYLLDGLGDQVARAGDRVFCVRNDASGIVDVFKTLFRVRELLRYTERTRRNLELRGRRGWMCQCALARGEFTGLPQGGGSPAWMVLGPAVESIEAFWSDPSADHFETDGCWLEGAIAEPVHDYFEESSGRFFHGWYQPGYLRKEYARDEAGLEPAEDFLERLRYS